MAGVELEETRRSVSFDAVAGALEQPPSAARATSEETEYVPGPADLMANVHEDIRQRPRFRKLKSLGHIVSSRSPRKRFDMTQLPEDIQRVQKHLQRRFGEEYSLHIVFVIRTAVELHRAWHMTLLTSKIMQQLKDKFQLRTTWTLGVLRLKFRIEDGDYELHRKVPYDYDSEFQDKYTRIAVALIEGHIDVHRALQYQVETKQGLHTARSGLFFRDYPGRVLLYPLEAATCAVIFFGGRWMDGAIAGVTGLAAGLLEWQLGRQGEAQGRTRERNSQLQRLLSRPFSARFG